MADETQDDAQQGGSSGEGARPAPPTDAPDAPATAD